MAEIVIPYEPRRLQQKIHSEMAERRYGVLVCHRRFGKTVLAVNHLIADAIACQKPRPRFAYLAPYRAQAKTVAWDYVKHYTRPVPGVEVNEAELRVDMPNGARIQLFGADNPDALRGMYFDGVVMDEFGQMHREAWGQVVRPAISDRTGYALFLGTPKGMNAFFELYQHARAHPAEWMCHLYKASETAILDDTELTSAKASMSEDAYAQEYECSWEAAVVGSYYGKLLDEAMGQERITRVPVDPRIPVNTAWDLGFADSTAIWFHQHLGREIRLVDYHEDSGEPLPHYADVLKRKGYRYGEHLAPHDIEVREYISGQSRIEVAQALGITFRTIPATAKEDQIEAVRNTIPVCVFDETRCKPGLDALRHYRRDVNQRTGELKPHPLHDWSSHGADAFAVMATGGAPRATNVERPAVDTSWIV